MIPEYFNNYFQFSNYVKQKGTLVKPRGMATYELLNESFMYHADSMFTRPQFNQQLAWVELMMLVAGVYDPQYILYAAPKARMELYDPELMYGPVVVPQMEPVIDCLKKDSYSRRAIVTLGKIEKAGMATQPCTSTIQFLLRNQELTTIVSMRSQDMVLGLPYDLVMFGGLAQVVANELGARSGMVTINQGSAHVYTSTMHMLPTYNHFTRYQVDMGFYEACGVWRKALRSMDWKPVPPGIKIETWRAENAEDRGYAGQVVEVNI
jgi:thymidylate synthase